MIKLFRKRISFTRGDKISVSCSNYAEDTNARLIKKAVTTCLLLSGFLWAGEVMAANPFIGSKVKDLTSLAGEVKDQVQGNGVNIIANVIGVITLVMGAVTMNWRILGFAGAALAFINTFFPFVNNSLGS